MLTRHTLCWKFLSVNIALIEWCWCHAPYDTSVSNQDVCDMQEEIRVVCLLGMHLYSFITYSGESVKYLERSKAQELLLGIYIRVSTYDFFCRFP